MAHTVTGPRRMRALTRLAPSALLVLAIAGCATPELSSSVVVPGQFSTAPADAVTAEIAWWTAYGDPVLTDLITRAASENRDVRMAMQRVRAARAGETISRSWLLPSLGIAAAHSSQDTNYSGGARQAVPDTQTTAGGLGVSWEIDISGRLRAGAAAAAADTHATVDQARGIRLLVLADVATNYFTLTGALRQLDTVRAISAAEDQTLRLVIARQRVGLASVFDVERARTEAESARAAIPPIETLVAASRHRLAVLTGGLPADGAGLQPWSGAPTVPDIRAGQPAELLERRPDLLAARAQLQAANYRRRQAAAEWFPRLFTSALFGREGVDANGVSLGAARFANASALLTMPIFDWGRTRSLNEIAGSAQQEAVLRYEDAIVRALEDVENALVALQDQRVRDQALHEAATSADAALSRAQSLYDHGEIDLLPLLVAQRTRLGVRVDANESNTRLMLATIDLFKALGGGWQAFEPPPANTHPETLASTQKDPS